MWMEFEIKFHPHALVIVVIWRIFDLGLEMI